MYYFTFEKEIFYFMTKLIGSYLLGLVYFMYTSSLSSLLCISPSSDSQICILFLVQNDRQVSRLILEQFSGEKGLTSGLQFLCSSQSSLAAIFLGLRHALKLVRCNSGMNELLFFLFYE